MIKTPAEKEQYVPSNKDRWKNDYFNQRNLNDPKRIKQFKLDRDLLMKYITKGSICDVGCSTGEFARFLNWRGEVYGMEINEYAKNIASDIIRFDKNILTEKNFFDAVIFRGTIQHIDIPFYMIKKAYESLKRGGYIIFLATPNSSSILYKLKEDLPFLDWELNFYIPSEKDLVNSLKNFNFEVLEVQFPYLNSPYCNLIKDHTLFILNCLSKKFYKHAFWKSSMNIIAQKP